MNALALLVAAALAAAAAASPALGADSVARTYNAPAERVWTATEAVLRHLGWDIDEADRSIGFITTESRMMEGEQYGVYEKGIRHRLHLQIKPAGQGRSTVTIERAVFKRERILFVDKEEPMTSTDRSVERRLLDAIAKAL